MTPRSAAKAAPAAKKKQAVVKTARKAAGATVKKPVAAKKQVPARKPVATTGRQAAARRGVGVAAKAEAHPHPPVAYKLHSLLHTMHSIEHHEDHLCTLLTAIEREGAVSAALGQELAALLEELPMQAFVADLEAARRALASPARAASKRKGA